MFHTSCPVCGRDIVRVAARVNESKKRGWLTYCSQECLWISRQRRKIFVCSRKGCKNSFFRNFSDMTESGKYYCSHRCSALVSNLSRKKKIRICPNCGNKFTERRIYCSSNCIPIRVSKYTSAIVLERIAEFHNEFNRVPVKREMYGVYKVARKYFGMWNKAVKAAGFRPNPVMFAKKFVANDGDRCDSLAEKIIDDWLFARKVDHTRNFPYPGNKGFTVDFKIGNVWVEFLGLSGQLRRYDILKERKFRLAKKFGINLIRLYPKDLFPVNKLYDKFVQLKQISP